MQRCLRQSAEETEKMRTPDRAVIFLDRAFDKLMLVCCVLLMLLGVYSIADEARVYSGSQDRSLLAYKPQLKEAVPEEKRVSKDQTGWICVPGTGIDFPVLQGSDNSEYLNRDPYGEFSYSGSIFLDYRNSPDLSDGLSVIYGHHMSGGHMFGCLDAFRNSGFLEEHRTGSYSSKEGSFELEIFAAFECLATDPEVFRPGSRSMDDVCSFIQKRSGTAADPSRRILALTTCTAQGDDTRLVVAAYIKPTEVDD